MRLTLRTLLNWINLNLSENDSLLIAQKVEESELAKALKTQIENVMQIPDLPAPNVLDGTPLGNANSTAEYLDNSMQAEKTQDYEKFCIHSDVILGETASCHLILSRVLSEVPEPSPQLRNRLLELYQYIGTDDVYSLPTKSGPSPTIKITEELFSELPYRPAEILREADGSNPEKSEKVPAENTSSELSLPTSEKPNYWMFSTLALCALFLVWLATGLLFQNSIPGRMIRAALESPATASVQNNAPGNHSNAEKAPSN